VGAIHPCNRLALGAARGALQCVVWNIEMENSLVVLDAIGNVSVHGTIPINLWRRFAIIMRNSKSDESKWQGDASDTK
jgi:hypothetical protein